MNQPIRLKSNEYWGRRFGGFIEARPKGHDAAFGFALSQKKWATGRQNSETRGRRAHRVRQNNRDPNKKV